MVVSSLAGKGMVVGGMGVWAATGGRSDQVLGCNGFRQAERQ